MGLAAAAVYFLDPESGEARRNEISKRLERFRTAGEKPSLEKAAS
jgi:hypothetical protein